MEKAKIFLASFDRPNINYTITEMSDSKNQILNFIRKNHLNDSGIIYCISRKKVEDISTFLNKSGLRSVPYHAGLSKDIREKNQKLFIHEEGIIVVATLAFGMGINRNIRFVCHTGMPKSLESYCQEIGRAGRDGLPANAFMTYSFSDVIQQNHMIQTSDGSKEQKILSQRKLKALLSLCESVDCRRKVILNYFGEEYLNSCGNCDNCLNPPEKWDGNKEAKVVINSILAINERFGSGHLVDFICGKENEVIRKWNHQKLSIFGSGKGTDEKEWKSVIRQMVANGIIDIDLAGYGILKINNKSRDVVSGLESCYFRVYKKEATPIKTERVESGLSGKNNPNFEKLRQLRLKLAQEQGVPPYIIFSDKTLLELTEKKPKTLAQMRKIYGFGDVKLKKYGKLFLDELNS
jgi:ATP-dependent DNA helicase RecQ